jgi:3'-phosphoadenosine 5'-phosphosulfate sulfotransferase (PAPS reductase)/FAD synthetase
LQYNDDMIIKSHKELADHIRGRRILHMNSMGKDSIVCLEWLTTFAKPSAVVSLNLKYMAEHPGDVVYANYLKKRYPTVKFVELPNTFELSHIYMGIYQNPVARTLFLNKSEYNDFDTGKMIDELNKEHGLEYSCSGESKYESFIRSTFFHKYGLLNEKSKRIFPIGLMTKEQVMSIVRNSGMKLHPCYKVSKSTYDHPSFWKMRAAFIATPQYWETMKKYYPMIVLDKFRFEELFK